MATATATQTQHLVHTAGQPLALQLSFSLAEDLPSGSLLRLRAGGIKALRGYLATGMWIDDAELPVVHRFVYSDMKRRWSWYIRNMPVLTARLSTAAAAGTEVIVTAASRDLDHNADPYSDDGMIAGDSVFAGMTWTYHLDAASGPDHEHAQWSPASRAIEIEMVAGPAAILEATHRGPFGLAIQHYDSHLNPVKPDAATATVDGQRFDLEPSVAATCIPSVGPARVRVRDTTGREAVSSPPPQGLDERRVLFGEFHWHCDFSSDGQRPLREAMLTARDDYSLDFAGPADHLSFGDGTYGRRTVAEQAEICASIDQEGRFASLPSFELSGREGHANIITDDWQLLIDIARDIADHGHLEKPGRYPLKELACLCPPGRAMIVPHHTNADSWTKEKIVAPDGRPFWCCFDWNDDPLREVVRLAEIHQTRGCFEDEAIDEDWRIEMGGFGSSLRSALARGFRVGFTGGTDNHAGWPSRGVSSRIGLTGVYCDAVDRRDLFQALHARHCYATTGARIVADFRCRDAMMGDELELPIDGERDFRVLLRGTAPWDRVEIISAGTVLADLTPGVAALDIEASWSDDRPGRPLGCYYYLRARQVDGHCVWTSPIWLTYAFDERSDQHDP